MNIVSELEHVLAKEQRFLLSGEYEKLEALADQKTKLAERLARDTPDLAPGAYERLKEKTAYNDALLISARRGIQSAMAQLRQLAEGDYQATYSKEGERRPLSRQTSVTQKL